MKASYKNPNHTKMWPGFRYPPRIKHKANLQYLEKLDVLTSLQRKIVEDALEECYYEKKVKEKDEEGNEVDKKVFGGLTAHPAHIARLSDLLDLPVNEAKVDAKGDPWEKPEELTDEEREKLMKQAEESDEVEVVVEDEEIVKKLEDKKGE